MTSDSYFRLGSEWGLRGNTLLCPAEAAQAKPGSSSEANRPDEKARTLKKEAGAKESRFIEKAAHAFAYAPVSITLLARILPLTIFRST